MNSIITKVTDRIKERSAFSREKYLSDMAKSHQEGVSRQGMSCGNLAHASAGCGTHEKNELHGDTTSNIGIITAYNDMLSAHKPFEHFPQQIRDFAIKHKAVAQVAKINVG